MALGKLSHVVPREQWADEARDFTPWLSSDEGLSLLGEVLGMELELEDTEVSVGNYRADIVAKDTITNDYVVIENQLAPTDHDHIGKLFTYAASFGASVLVWIAEKFREEHRQAIDWFNNMTIKDVDFFGIEIELVRIDDSPYAPNFKIVSKPNEWTRDIRIKKSELSEQDQFRLEFWTRFNEYIQEQGLDIRKRKPQAWQYYDLTTGWKKGTAFSLVMRTSKREVAFNLWLTGNNAKPMFKYLYKYKDEIESIIGYSLNWEELPDKKSSAIGITKDLDPLKKEDWIVIYEWYYNTLLKFRNAFIHRIKSFTR
jgi:hypothetical protein